MKAGTAAMRPWGAASWIFEKLPGRKWSVLGCLGPEERSLAIWEYARSQGMQSRSFFIRIQPNSSRYLHEYEDRLRMRTERLEQIGRPSEEIAMPALFATDAEIVQLVDQFASICEPHVILDFSCFPKRFFFPFVKRLLSKPKIETLLATYTIPERYPSELLAEDHQAFAHLPMFGPSQFPEKRVELVIVTAGFLKLGLAELLEPYKTDVKIQTILPFPPGPPAYHRNWEFIREMEKTLPSGLASPIRIEAYDCADAFSHLTKLTLNGMKNAILAPFGPKPLSLAMCLFASLAGNVVYYTQPTVYNPDYSIGIKKWDGKIAAYAYALRLNGTNVYALK